MLQRAAFQKTTALLLTVVLFFCAIPFQSFAYNAETGEGDYKSGNFTYDLINNKTQARIAYSPKAKGAVTIPKTLGGKPVVEIADYAFEYTPITSVVIPEGVKKIGNEVFYSCEKLKTVTIPKSVTKIGVGIFSNNFALTSVTVTNGNTTYASKDGVLYNKAFTTLIHYPSAKASTSFTVPSTVTKITKYAIYACSKLQTLTIPASVTNMQYATDMMGYITSLANQLGDSAKVTKSGCESIFEGCTALKSIQVAAKNSKYISKDGVLFLKDAKGKPGTLMLYPGQKENAAYSVPSTVTVIFGDAFATANKLSSITIPAGINRLESAVTVSVPDITSFSLRFSFFAGLPKLATIKVAAANTKYETQDGVLFNKGKTRLVQYPSAKTATAYTVPYSVTSMNNYAFLQCTNLQKLSIFSRVKTLPGTKDALSDPFGTTMPAISYSPNVTIMTYSATAAHTYAKKTGQKLKLVTIPTSVSLNKSSVKLVGGKTETLKATLQPAAAQTALDWRSSNPAVADIDRNGKIIAKKSGSATITVTTANGKKQACAVTVTAPTQTKVEMSSTKLTLAVGQNAAIKVNVLPLYASQKVTWKSSNSKLATIANGNVTAIKPGKVTISATTPNGIIGKSVVTVKAAPASVKLSKTSVSLGVGETYKPTAALSPSGAYSSKNTWSTNNSAVATVDQKGNITAKKAGTAKITVTTHNKKTATITVTVKSAPKSIKLNRTSAKLKIGKTVDLNSSVNSGAASNKRSYSSGNTKVATVNSSGLVTAKAKGTTVITVKTYNNKKATCTITVS